MSPVPNPFDPRLRNDLSANEKTVSVQPSHLDDRTWRFAIASA
jgi:hypothetical protein